MTIFSIPDAYFSFADTPELLKYVRALYVYPGGSLLRACMVMGLGLCLPNDDISFDILKSCNHNVTFLFYLFKTEIT